MLAQRALGLEGCVRCRLRGLIRAKEIERVRKTCPSPAGSTASVRSLWTRKALEDRPVRRSGGPSTLRDPRRRGFSTITPIRYVALALGPSGISRRQEIELVEGLYTSGHITRDEWRESVFAQAGLKGDDESIPSLDAGDAEGLDRRVKMLREYYASESVPEQLLEEAEIKVHERLFGDMRQVELDEGGDDGELDLRSVSRGTGVLKDDGAGGLEEVIFDEDDMLLEAEEDVMLAEEGTALRQNSRYRPANERLAEEIQAALEAGSTADMETGQTPLSPEALQAQDELAEQATESYQRTHPLTLANRFTTHPTTLEIPKRSFVDPVTTMLETMSSRQRSTHLPDAAHRIFGGPGLPYSTSTPERGKTMQQKPIALDASQGNMSDIEGDVFMTTLMPGMYASVMAVLVETRKRLGTSWAEGLVKKAESGELKILDAGGAGAGVLAVREIIRAEWERIRTDNPLPGAADGAADGLSSMALAEADGRVGGEGVSAPLGHATVLTSSDVLRHRASKILENTTFVPRLPDYLHADIGAQGKFDVVIASHTLWPLREDFLRKSHVQNLWTLLSQDGGVLCLVEKGVARGFEMIAGARDLLLESRISSPGSTERPMTIEEPIQWEATKWDSSDAVAENAEGEASKEIVPEPQTMSQPKETGMIIAPCTNHGGCPMFSQKGMIKGRREICAFEQRYHRPQFLQKIFGTRGRNHEDVEFSYLAVIRGRDLRQVNEESESIGQDERATKRAFAGYEQSTESAAERPDSLTLPRAVFPPMKRQGHVIIDLCTPSGTLERWTVPRSFSKQAFRDARKVNWGDLWALGAKTRVPRNVKGKTKGEMEQERTHDVDVKLAKKQKKQDYKKVQVAMAGGVVLESDEFGRVRSVGDAGGGESGKGRVRSGKKIKGIRDKRDKYASGNGRRKISEE